MSHVCAYEQWTWACSEEGNKDNATREHVCVSGDASYTQQRETFNNGQ